MVFRPVLPTRLIQRDHRSISSLRQFTCKGKYAGDAVFFFCTLPRHDSFNTVRLSPRSDFLLARVHAHPFFLERGRRRITSMIPCQLQSRAPCTHVEQRATLAQFEFAFVFRHSACHVENSLRRFADAGQTRDTRTRVAKHTIASVKDEDDARKSVLKHPTLFVQSPLYLKKWSSPPLVRRGAL